jgi:hypothetical protein
MVLGGSLNQLLIPFIAFASFYYKKRSGRCRFQPALVLWGFYRRKYLYGGWTFLEVVLNIWNGHKGERIAQSIQ